MLEHSSYIDFPQPFQKIGFSESIRQKLYNSNPLFLDANIAVARVCHPVSRDLDVDDAWNRCGSGVWFVSRSARCASTPATKGSVQNTNEIEKSKCCPSSTSQSETRPAGRVGADADHTTNRVSGGTQRSLRRRVREGA